MAAGVQEAVVAVLIDTDLTVPAARFNDIAALFPPTAAISQSSVTATRQRRLQTAADCVVLSASVPSDDAPVLATSAAEPCP